MSFSLEPFSHNTNVADNDYTFPLDNICCKHIERLNCNELERGSPRLISSTKWVFNERLIDWMINRRRTCGRKKKKESSEERNATVFDWSPTADSDSRTQLYLGSFCYKKILRTTRERLLHRSGRSVPTTSRDCVCLVGVPPGTHARFPFVEHARKIALTQSAVSYTAEWQSATLNSIMLSW